jgi:serine/threonine protein phosphatase PrpC
MKFRWKLLILLPVISLIPVVSLRTFGIQNVRLMADALISQVKGKQLDDARHRLQLVIDDYSKVIRTSREQAEMARIDRRENRMDWVRAGHDPAILYDLDTDSFSSMDDENGIPLGISQDAVYTVSSCDIKPGQIIFMGTDGIWEARNAQGELFGKESLQQVIHTNSRESARTIALSMPDAVEEHRGRGEQEDDSTLVVIKIIDV